MDFTADAVIDTAELRRRGLSQRQIDRLVSRGRLHRVERGVFTTSPPTGHLLLRALRHRRPGLIFTGRTSLEIRQGKPLSLPVQAVVGPTQSFHSNTHLRLLRRTSVGTAQVQGFTVTVGAVAVAHADESTDEELIAYLEEHYAGRAGKATLAAEIATMKRIPATFQALVARAAIGADSEAELLIARALLARGIALEQNAYLGGYYFDILIPQAQLIIEIDGFAYHSGESRETFVQDRWKANYATRHGYRVLRYSGSCVKYHLSLVVEQIVAVVEKHGAELESERKPVWKWHHMFTRDGPWPEEVAQ
ncbi:DUF559 domain-containing protein [Corynebacterium nasicanis]|uniref:DUF559 domain-containing protein n=1 Tax=Corynebacterium nasicanis TaxID=1448267 RepID=A0ABW1QE90_9CORY